jgi:hypothetical protein
MNTRKQDHHPAICGVAHLEPLGRLKIIRAAAILMLFILCGCTPAAPAQPAVNLTQVFANALLTATYAVKIPTPALASTTPLPPTIASTQPAPATSAVPVTLAATDVRAAPLLPPVFTSSILNSLDIPQAYITDTCQYLKRKWDPNNSDPGTVVMPIMYHSITGDGKPLANSFAIHHSDLVTTLEHAKEVGFETITIAQLVDFLYNNAKIPKRSLLLIQDDRSPGSFRLAFGPYLDKYHWTLTWAWPIADTDGKPPSNGPGEDFKSLWEQMESYYSTGQLDIQAHGFIHNIPIGPNSTDEFIRHEMVDSRKVLQDHFYCKDSKTGQPAVDCKSPQPLAYIWPLGGFSKRAAEIGREAGYQVGFTTVPRGPIMFNWVPQAQQDDPNRPSWPSEGQVEDPLMTLPRYWSTDAAFRIDEVLDIGSAAAKYAAENKTVELDYYAVKCSVTSGPIPTLRP